MLKYRKYARPFHPLRFLNLLPLSHMFGQSMATNIPPMVRGTVIFTRSFNPHDIAAADQVAAHLGARLRAEDPRRAARARRCARCPKPRSRRRRASRSRADGGATAASTRAFGLKFWAFVVGAAPLPPELEEFWRRLGFAVIQGYGLTETAPIVTLNHPFKTSKGSVGHADRRRRDPDRGRRRDSRPRRERHERLLRAETSQRPTPKPNTRSPDPDADSVFDAEGWLHTGDIGERDAQGRLFIKGRKKEMIVTPEGLNVFPDDVERVLDELPGVRESAVVGVATAREERVHAVLVLEPGTDADAVVRDANARLQDHQRIRSSRSGHGAELPRTEGTRKLKRSAIRDWVRAGGSARSRRRPATRSKSLARAIRARAAT